MEAQNSVVHAFLLLLWWAALLSVSVGWLVLKNPAKASDLVWRSREYTQSMFHWIDSGKLPEGSGPAVVLFHVKQTLIYCLLALFSANFLALVLGSALLNYMNFYVLSLYRERSSSAKVLLMAWNPWSVIRVLAFLYLGIVVSTPSLWLLIPVPWTLSFVLFLPGFIGIVLDVVLKLSLSRSWSTKLRPV